MLWMVLNVVGHGDVVGDAVDGDDGIKYLALAGEWCSLLASRVVVAVAVHQYLIHVVHHRSYERYNLCDYLRRHLSVGLRW